MTVGRESPETRSLPVTADQKVASVLKAHPGLLDVFTAQSQAFDRLKNPLMRKTFARMASVGQAAAVAGMPVDDLLRALNSALGVPDEEIEAALAGAASSPAPADADPRAGGTPGVAGARRADGPPDWLAAPVVAELDARDMQRRGEDPFFTIMDAARGVDVGRSLTLRNTFRPDPLLGVLGKKGFASWAEQLGPEDWLITFHRERAVDDEVDAQDVHPHGATRPGPPEAAADETPAGGAASAGAEGSGAVDPAALLSAEGPPAEDEVDAVVTITVEDLTPPLPMQKVLEGLAPVPQGGLLLVHHLRMPPHLTAKLDEYGHAYRIWDLGPDRKEILIHKVGG